MQNCGLPTSSFRLLDMESHAHNTLEFHVKIKALLPNGVNTVKLGYNEIDYNELGY